MKVYATMPPTNTRCNLVTTLHLVVCEHSSSTNAFTVLCTAQVCRLLHTERSSANFEGIQTLRAVLRHFVRTVQGLSSMTDWVTQFESI